VGFGTVAIFTAWLPLSALAGAIGSRIAARAEGGDPSQLHRAGATIALVHAVGLALGAVAGGYVVGRWGETGAGVREAALAGLGAAIVAAGVSWASFGPTTGAILVTLVAVPMAALGGRLGLRGRAR
jgi:hypothetical protein